MTAEEMLDAINKHPDCRKLYNDIHYRLEADDYQRGTELIKNHFQCDDETAECCLMLYKERFFDPFMASFAPGQRARVEAEARLLERKRANQPKCPTCGSTDLKKISGTAKAAGALAFGLFSKTARSQFQCRNCGYKW